jgi:hypothetical protein
MPTLALALSFLTSETGFLLDVAVRQKTASPGPQGVKVLQFVRIPPEMVQIQPV